LAHHRKKHGPTPEKSGNGTTSGLRCSGFFPLSMIAMESSLALIRRLAMKSTKHDLVIQKLIEDLNALHPVVRVHAATILGSMGEKAVAAVPALIELLQAENAHDRKLAALTLGEIGPAAEEAMPALFAAVDDEDDGVSEMAEWALVEIDAVEDQDEAA
jgi:HEAT repeat protein